jgi:hypothetical protein
VGRIDRDEQAARRKQDERLVCGPRGQAVTEGRSALVTNKGLNQHLYEGLRVSKEEAEREHTRPRAAATGSRA